MTINLIVLVFISTIGICYSQYPYCQAPGYIPSSHTEGLTLRHVQLLTRHGDRSPTWVMPSQEVVWNCTLTYLNYFNDEPQVDHEKKVHRLYRKPYMPGRNSLLGNCGLGQLTEKGLEQHINLGTQFREIYIDQLKFLPDLFNSSLIWIRSTDVPRTVMSAMGNLYAMYPPQKRVDGGVDLVDINTMDVNLEDMTPNPAICPRYGQIQAEQVQTPAFVQQNATWQPLVDQLAQIFNVTPQNVPTFQGLWDNLAARACHNLSLPVGVTHEVMEAIYNITYWQQNYTWFNPQEAAILGSGMLLQELYNRMIAKIAGDEQYLLRFYSGHDSTVGPLMALLGTYNGWPPYASNVIFELWSDNQENYYLQLKYNGEIIELPGCSDIMCPFDQFESLVESLIPSDWTEACTPTNGKGRVNFN